MKKCAQHAVPARDVVGHAIFGGPCVIKERESVCTSISSAVEKATEPSKRTCAQLGQARLRHHRAKQSAHYQVV
eukprot:2209445-Prymnesium_polylepis.2